MKTVNFAPTITDKRQQASLAIELTTADREHVYIAVTAEEKKEFIVNLRKVCTQTTIVQLLFQRMNVYS